MAGAGMSPYLLCCIAIMPRRAYGLARGRFPLISPRMYTKGHEWLMDSGRLTVIPVKTGICAAGFMDSGLRRNDEGMAMTVNRADMFVKFPPMNVNNILVSTNHRRPSRFQ